MNSTTGYGETFLFERLCKSPQVPFIFHHKKKIGQPICKREWRTNHKNDIIATILEMEHQLQT